MKIFLRIALILLSALAYGQTIIISGFVKDPSGNPYQNGNGRAVLTPTNQNWLINGTNPVSSPVVISGLDSFGFFSLPLPPTNIISPQSANPQWQFSFCSQSLQGQQPVCFTMTPMSLTTSQDISAAIIAQSAPLPSSGGGGTPISIQTNGTPNTVQNILNLAQDFPITIADNGLGKDTFGLTKTCTDQQVLQFNIGLNQWQCGSITGTVPTLPVPPAPLINTGASVTPIYAQGVTIAYPSVMTWRQSLSTVSDGRNSAATVTLPAGIAGIDVTSGDGYEVYICDGTYPACLSGSTSEPVMVTGGTYTFASGGTVIFTPALSHSSYVLMTASSGIQESLNAACGTDPVAFRNGQCHVIIPANNGPQDSTGLHPLNNIQVLGTIFIHANQSIIDGSGNSLYCAGALSTGVGIGVRGPCMVIGDLTSFADYQGTTIRGFQFRSPATQASSPAYNGVAITQTCSGAGAGCGLVSGVGQVTTATPHGFRVGDIVTIRFTDNAGFWGDAIVLATPSTTTFQFAHNGAVAVQTTPGIVALAYSLILDNASNTSLVDISIDSVAEVGKFNEGIDVWGDQNLTIEHFSNSAIALNGNVNWTGCFICSFGNSNVPSQQFAPVITINDSTITANGSEGVTDYNSNGLYINNTIIQASGLWGVYASNTTGNLQGVSLDNVYFDTNVNPASPVKTPWAGLGSAGLIVGKTATNGIAEVKGLYAPSGGFVSVGGGGTCYTYFIIVNDGSAHSSPMQILTACGTSSNVITWPRVANSTDTITYDILRVPDVSVSGVYPGTVSNCPGGSASACGSVTTALSQATACGNTLTCTFTDPSPSGATTAYSTPGGTYIGAVNWWPGTIVSENKTVYVSKDQSSGTGIGLFGQPLQHVERCIGYGQTSPGGYTVCDSGSIPSNTILQQPAMLVKDGPSSGGGKPNLTGILDFTTMPNVTLGPTEVITVVDSNPELTQNTSTMRRAPSANDVWIGTDSTAGTALTGASLAFGSKVFISFYINAIPNSSSTGLVERISSTTHTFNIAALFTAGVTMNSTVSFGAASVTTFTSGASAFFASGSSLTFSGITGGTSQCLHVSTVGLVSGTGVDCGSGSGSSVWSALTNPTTDLSLTMAHISTFTSTDLGASPATAGIWNWLGPTSSASTDTSVEAYINSNGSYHQPFEVLVNNSGSSFPQLEVCNSGCTHIGFVMVGNNAGAQTNPCTNGVLSFSTISKLTVMANTGAHVPMTLFHSNAGQSGTSFRVISVATTGFKFASFQSGASADSTGGTEVASIGSDGGINSAASLSVGSAITYTKGTSGEAVLAEGTAPSSISSTFDAFYADSTNHCFSIINAGTTNIGCGVGTTGTQTLSAKTLTSPTINGGALSGTFTGAPTLSGNVAFTGHANFLKSDCTWQQYRNHAKQWRCLNQASNHRLRGRGRLRPAVLCYTDRRSNGYMGYWLAEMWQRQVDLHRSYRQSNAESHRTRQWRNLHHCPYPRRYWRY